MSMLAGPRVRHTVVFALRHPAGSAEEASFLEALATLAEIDGVEELQVAREVSPKNEYTHAVAMEFADEQAYRTYDADPRHQGFVTERWDAEVSAFLEVDTVALEG
ncbi:Dabb family protein [Nocardioides nanhaiensis]|uniref:Dabb family protein n=1 Tax=Nocardioides nanhaiensis TaxID=1476871 RepID=A0ABP8VUG9_9ACTN